MVVKPGFKTTEFAITVLTDVGIVAAALAGNLTPRWAAIAAAVSTSAYALARGLAKQPAKAVPVVTSLPPAVPTVGP